MADTEIPPALTPEEWAERAWKSDHAEAYVSPESPKEPDGPKFVGLWPTDYDEPARIFSDRLPALIALANAARADDDPGKITREAVARLRRAVVMDEFEPIVDRDETEELQRLAAALEALLPPETS